MKKALLVSATLHLGLLALIWYWGTSFSRPPLQGYPLTINATFVEKSAISKNSYHSPAPPSTKRISEKPPEPAKTAVKPKPVPEKPKPETETPPNAAGESGGPSGTSLSIDVLEFPFPQYLSLLQYRVERQWQPPVSDSEVISSIVFFTISQEGKLSKAILEKSSGNFTFDQAALRAVYNADPFPPLPPEATLASLGVHFEFVGRR